VGGAKPSFGPTPPKAAQRLSDPNKRVPAPPLGSQGEVSPVHVQKPERFPLGADIPVTPANGVTAALFAPLTVVSGASPYSHYASRNKTAHVYDSMQSVFLLFVLMLYD